MPPKKKSTNKKKGGKQKGSGGGSKTPAVAPEKGQKRLSHPPLLLPPHPHLRKISR